MMPGRLRRARRMTFDEARWRTRELAATLRDRVRFKFGTPQWPRTKNASIATSVCERLQREPSRCVMDPSVAASVRQEVLTRWPSAAADASSRADRILAGHYDLLGYRGLTFDDWHSDPVHHRRAPLVYWADVQYLDPSIGDHKIIWELNRHQYWLQLGRAYCLTGDPRYAQAIVDQMESWLERNPPLAGINWASMLEISFRTLSWTIAIHFLAAGRRLSSSASPLPTARCFTAIDRQLTHVEQHLSYYFSPNTHLTGEALALYVVGQAFPELASSGRWIETGRRILLREIDRQILPDGGHIERSMHYQRYTLDFYLLALLTARRARDADAAQTFAAASTRLAEFTVRMADDDGRLPLIGDDDGGMLWPIAGRECNDVRDSLATAAVVLNRPDLARWGLQEETFWIATPEAISFAAAPARTFSGLRSRAFADTGYVVMRDDTAHAVFDTGAHGYMNGGHAHADALSLTLNVGGRPLLVDPGTSTYTMDSQLRDRMRGSLNHNTVSIDGRPQSIPAGPFHWATAANARLIASRHNAGFDWAAGTHDGYAPIEHRRSVIRAHDAGWLVVDELRPTDVTAGSHAAHSAATHWNFHPGWMLRSDEKRQLRATHLEGDEAWLLFDVGQMALFFGDEETGLGWYSPVYGTVLPTWTARITRQAPLPFSVLSWIGAATAATTPVLQRLCVDAGARDEAIAARVSNGDVASTYVLRSGEPRDSRACGLPEYQSNAHVLHFRTQSDALVALDLVQASHALALRDGWLSVAASEPVHDLHVGLHDGILELCASEPPRQLRIQGRTLIGLHAIELNGRPYRVPFGDRPDTLLISGADWAVPLVRLGVPFALDEVHPSRV
jgi:uncharacterized heparinase superfamily protein